MAKKIERKYLIKNEAWKKRAKEGKILKQGYLNTDPERTVRIRLEDKRGILTIKSKNVGITRNEYEIPFTNILKLLKRLDMWWSKIIRSGK